ncbi:LacI family DNA-binding transcriptional regulator [Alkalicoccus halolimnae]|uniref:LacI family DNA-binding transcriptional regulator n=1 Tax=Alkalicoccus halolimnae TaxID=1667239 RepID=A0AAJ8LU58_9BACI|nr:LacI family DNA-binding transcriptional regulator [Alkalicoccus halolimnae]
MEKRATIRDVAERAKVSKTTVSYVLNDVKKVSEDTRKRVLEAMAELHYEPDFTAISLTKRKSQLIGVIMPLVNESIAAVMQENTYFNEMISAIEKVARENGFDILLTGLAEPERYRAWVQKRHLDGLLFLGLFPEEIYSEMRSMDVPAILIDTYETHTGDYPSVNVDDEKGGYEAARHLLALGHKQTAFLTSNRADPVERERYKGFQRAYKEAAVKLPPPVETASVHSFESGYAAGRKILEEERFTAVSAGSDTTALGIVRAVHDAGKEVPGDLSVTGFDDIRMSRYLTPALTTVRQHIERKGMIAAKKLVHVINGGQEKAEMIDIELVVRDSTGPAPG